MKFSQLFTTFAGLPNFVVEEIRRRALKAVRLVLSKASANWSFTLCCRFCVVYGNCSSLHNLKFDALNSQTIY